MTNNQLTAAEMPIFESTQPTIPSLRKGLRLWRAEVMNWGTLGENMIHAADFRGGWLCITGRNGTGKSTLADAITTAFPPAGVRIQYNAAGGAKDTKDRTRLTYLRGYYGHEQDESGRSQPSTLRTKPGTPTAILLQFHDESAKKWVTLLVLGTFDAQNEEHWLYGTIERKADLTLIQGKEDWDSRAKRLRKDGWTIGSEPGAYRERLIELLRIPSEKAIKTFVRTVGLKDIGDVNVFIRQHMLEDVSIHARYIELTKHYQKQLEIDAEIQRTVSMINQLLPLDELVPAYMECGAELAQEKQIVAAVDWRVAQGSADLINSLIDAAVRESESIEGMSVGVKTSIAQVEGSIATVGASEPAIRAAALTARSNELTARRRTTEGAQTQFTAALKSLKVHVPLNETSFQEARAKLQDLVSATDESAETMGDALAERKIQLSEKRKKQEELRDDIGALGRAASHLPREDIERRQQIAAEFGMKESELPYVGELVDVEPAQSEWRNALEKLLRTYARRMLVPENRFLEIARYVNVEDWGSRVRMQKVRAKVARYSMNPPAANAACRKLRVKNSSPFAEWVRSALESDFDHKCFKDVGEYDTCSAAAITSSGLIKGGRGDYHEKKDDIRIRDVRDYYLGWDNEEKIRSLKAEDQRLDEEIIALSRAVEVQREANTTAKDSRDLAKAILANITAFDQINLSAVNIAIAELEAERRQFAKLDPEAAQIEAQLAKLSEELSNLRTTQEALATSKGGVAQRLKALRAQLVEIEEERSEVAPTETASARAGDFFTDALPAVASGLPKWSRAVSDRTAAHFSKHRVERNRLSLEIKGVMSSYLTKFPTERNTLSDSMDAVDAFVARRRELEAEKLGELQARFHKYIEENLALHASQLKVTLKEQIADSEKRIEEINSILSKIPWDDDQVVQIKPRKNPQQEIRDFEELLNAASAPLFNPTKQQSADAFEAVKKVIVFIENENVRKLVLDARNHQLFTVVITPTEENSTRRPVSMETTGGLSGGQKNKLSVTLLASALAYQYDIAGANSHCATFRTVIIDEAFAKLDSENARFALELFRKFDFQLVLVHPLDGTVRVAEDYVNGFLLATIRDNKYSSLTGIQIEELRSAIGEIDAEQTAADNLAGPRVHR